MGKIKRTRRYVLFCCTSVLTWPPYSMPWAGRTAQSWQEMRWVVTFNKGPGTNANQWWYNYMVIGHYIPWQRESMDETIFWFSLNIFGFLGLLSYFSPKFTVQQIETMWWSIGARNGITVCTFIFYILIQGRQLKLGFFLLIVSIFLCTTNYKLQSRGRVLPPKHLRQKDFEFFVLFRPKDEESHFPTHHNHCVLAVTWGYISGDLHLGRYLHSYIHCSLKAGHRLVGSS